MTMNRVIVSCKGFFYQRPNLKQVDRNVVPCLEGSTTVLASEASHRSDQRNHGRICSCNCNSPSSRFVNRQSHVCTASPHGQLVIADQQRDVYIFSQSARLHRHAKGQILRFDQITNFESESRSSSLSRAHRAQKQRHRSQPGWHQQCNTSK